jgi:hypothetical protein
MGDDRSAVDGTDTHRGRPPIDGPAGVAAALVRAIVWGIALGAVFAVFSWSAGREQPMRLGIAAAVVVSVVWFAVSLLRRGPEDGDDNGPSDGLRW